MLGTRNLIFHTSFLKSVGIGLNFKGKVGSCALPPSSHECAFEMGCSTLRFGKGVTAEIGYDVQNLGSKKPLIVTDKNVVNTRAFREVAASLGRLGTSYDVFDEIRCEPSMQSMQKAVDFTRSKNYDCFLAVGGGSVIDTAKIKSLYNLCCVDCSDYQAAALYASNPDAEFLDYVQKPFGKGLYPDKPILPLIAVPTTAGTGSETTAVAIMDIPELQSKAGIRLRCIKPFLAIIDPLNVMSMPRNVAVYSGFDVLCHALESYTAKSYTKRSRPSRPDVRPVYQGSNPVSDVWVREALQIVAKYFRRSIFDPADEEARTQMLMASSFAGMGFGNAGVHLCHGLSYPISSLGKNYFDPDYGKENPLIPHGLSVVCTSPADFIFTTSAEPKRHLEASQLLGSGLSDTANADMIGNTLADQLRSFMSDFGCPNGIGAMGFDRSTVDKLADSAIKSLQSNPISPREVNFDSIARIYEQSLTVY